MKKRSSGEQIIGFLKQAEAGVPVRELRRQYGFSDTSFYNCRTKYGWMTVPDVKTVEGAGSGECSAQDTAGRGDAEQRSAQGGPWPKALTPQDRREAVMTMRRQTSIRREGTQANHKRVYQLYSEAPLAVHQQSVRHACA